MVDDPLGGGCGQKWDADTGETAPASPNGSVLLRRSQLVVRTSLEWVELGSDSGTEEEGGGGSWVIFPKEVPFQEAHEGLEGVRGSSLPFLFALPCSHLAQPQEVGDP